MQIPAPPRDRQLVVSGRPGRPAGRVSSRVQAALQLMEDGNLEAAASLLAVVRRKTPTLHHMLATVAGRMGRHDLALDHLRQADLMQPGDPRIRTGIAAALYGLGKYAAARLLLNRVLARPAPPADAWFFSALLHRRQERVDLALEDLERCLECNASHGEGNFEFAVLLLRTSQPLRAFPYARQAADVMPDNRHALFNAALAAQRTGNFPIAERYYQACLELEPESRKARFGLAVCYQERGLDSESRKIFRTLLGETPTLFAPAVRTLTDSGRGRLFLNPDRFRHHLLG